MEISDIPCIRGKRQKAWSVLPTTMIGGVSCVAISTRKPWLHQLLAGVRFAEEYVNGIANFVDECRQAARTVLEPAEDSSKVNPASSQGNEASNKGRDFILGESDSDQEKSHVPPRREQKKTSSRRGQKKASLKAMARGGHVTVQVRDFKVTVAGMDGKRILLPATHSSLDALINHLGARAGEDRVPLMADGADECEALLQGAVDASTYLTNADPGRISWFAGGKWCVRFKDGEGRIRRTTGFLKVPTRHLTGVVYSPERFEAARKQVLNKARKRWNELDKSDRERFELTE